MRRLALALWLAMVLCVCVAVGAAQAQTNTPTPTRTPTPSPTPHYTVEPIGIPTDTSFDGDFRYCLQTKYQVQAWDNIICNSLTFIRYDPQLPDSSDGFTYATIPIYFASLHEDFSTARQKQLVFIPPGRVTSFDVYCTYTLTRNHTNPIINIKANAGSLGGGVSRSGSWSSIGIPSGDLDGGASLDYVRFTYTNWEANNPNWRQGSYANPYTTLSSWPSISIEHSHGVLPGAGPSSFGEASCTVINWITEAASGPPVPPGTPSLWMPAYTPVASSTPTPANTPTPGGIAINTPVPWVMTPDDTEFGITPGDSECVDIIPAFEFGPYDVFGYSVGFEWDYVEVCGNEYDVSMKWLEINWGLWLLGLVGVGAVGMIYSRLK